MPTNDIIMAIILAGPFVINAILATRLAFKAA